MDINVAGLNKVYCFVSSSSLNGRTVKLTDSINTWTKTISSLSCVFMIPSMPAPAKHTYTVSLMNSAGTAAEYSRQIELGFGDSVKIGLFTNNETADKAYVLSEITSHAYSLPTAASGTKGGVKVTSGTSNGVYMDGEQLKTYLASATQLGSMKVGTGLSVGSGADAGKVSLRAANSSDIGGVIIGDGLQVTNNKTVVKPYNGINVDGSGVGVKTSTGLTVSSSGVSLSKATSDSIGGVKPGIGLDVSFEGTLYVKEGKGIRASRDGGVYLSPTYRSSYTHYVTTTIPAGETKETTYNIVDSTLKTRLGNGFIYGLESTSTDCSVTLEDVSFSGDTISVRVNFCNPYSSSKTSNGIYIRYWYFD